MLDSLITLSNKVTAMSKHVCVIGAGSSGLMVMKELQSVGHTFHCFELLPNVGGVRTKYTIIAYSYIDYSFRTL